MTETPSPHIVILGAGITGLACAWKILKDNPAMQVTLLEQEEEPGGLAKSIRWHDYMLDLGPHRFHTEIDEIKAFVQTFCASEMHLVKRASRMYINNRFIPYPIKPLATMQALGLVNTICFGVSALKTLLPGADEAESYEDYVSGYYGRALYEKIFGPFARKVWGIDPGKMAAETARVRLRGDTIFHALLDGLFSRQETYVSEFLYPPEGIGQIARKFAQEIEACGGHIRCSHTVKSLHHEDNKIRTIVYDSPEGEGTLTCDTVINTLPLPVLAPMLLPAPDPTVLQKASQLQYRPIVLLYLLFDEYIEMDDTWLYFPEANVPFTRIYVPDNFRPDPKNRTQTCFCVEFTCETEDTLWTEDAQTLQQRAMPILMESGVVTKDPMDSRRIGLRYGYPVYHVGYEEALHDTLRSLASYRNLLTTGRQGLFRHNNIDQAMQMGLSAAQTALSGPNSFQKWYEQVDRFREYRIVD